jgi:DNA adenine methylase
METNNMIAQPIKIHGGKHYLASWITDLMPPHLHYVEPFFGGGSVLLARDPNRDWLKGHPDWPDVAAKRGASEVVNDLSDELTNFWRVLQDEKLFERFQRKVSATPFSSIEWHEAAKPDNNPVSQAVAFFVRARQSMAGRQDCFNPLSKTRTRGNRNEQANAWWNAIEGLPVVHRRLQGVVILKDDAIRVIQQQDNEKTLFYLDPPYIHSTRMTTGEYSCEMTNAQHKTLLDTLAQIRGKFMLSGYRCDLYDQAAVKHGWTRHEKVIDNKASSQKTKPKKVECIWTNYA